MSSENRASDLQSHSRVSHLVFPLGSTLMLGVLVLAGDQMWLRSSPRWLIVLALILGGWQGLTVVGHLADAIGSATNYSKRAQILGDPFVGSFGVCAMATSIVVQMAVALSIQSLTFSLAVSPLTSSVMGLASGTLVAQGNKLAKGIAIVGLLLSSVLIATMHGTIMMSAISLGVSMLTAWNLRRELREGRAVGPLAASHCTLLTLLVLQDVPW